MKYKSLAATLSIFTVISIIYRPAFSQEILGAILGGEKGPYG